MALRLINTIEAAEKAKTKPKIPSIQVENESKENDDTVVKYETGQIVNKEYTDKMGQRDNVIIPKFMQKDAKIPDHVNNLKCEKIEFPKTYYKNGVWAVLIRNVLSKNECDELIKLSEEQGYEDALVNIGYGRQKKMPEFRNCQRMMIDNFDMVNCLWNRINKFIPTYFQQRKKLALNERLRFLRYHKGEYFAPHYDGTYRRENGEISKMTVLLYLNDEFKGGSTRFLRPFCESEYHAPKIEPGMIIMFQHDTYHEGAILEQGTKYIVRTDVMFTKKKYGVKSIAKAEDNVAVEYVEYQGFKTQEQLEEEAIDEQKENK